MNKAIRVGFGAVLVLVWCGIARADDTVLYCGAPRALEQGTLGSRVQVCEVVPVKPAQPSVHVTKYHTSVKSASRSF